MLMTQPSIPPLSDYAADFVNDAGGKYLTALVDVLPLLVPFLLGVWALGFIWVRAAPGGGAGASREPWDGKTFYADTLGDKARGHEARARRYGDMAYAAEDRGDLAAAARYSRAAAREWKRASEDSQDEYYGASSRQRRRYDRQMARAAS